MNELFWIDEILQQDLYPLPVKIQVCPVGEVQDYEVYICADIPCDPLSMATSTKIFQFTVCKLEAAHIPRSDDEGSLAILRTWSL